MNDKLVFSVTEINSYIKQRMDGDVLLSSLYIRGEVSNYKKYPSGHHYFTLKDENSSLRCVLFRGYARGLRFSIENGMDVVASGRVSVYPRDGAYQLYCTGIHPVGTGDLAFAFEQLRKKLEKEGLFSEEHKKRLPLLPDKIAVITSSAGAAVHDILRILRRRFPLTDVIIVPVHVQGEGAANEIAAAIDLVNELHLADLIITGRGGGSMEDLWAFNEEVVARAIWRSQIPIISAVGHEPDVTIADYVADVRAATPSHAAEIAVPDQIEFLNRLDALRSSLEAAVRGRIDQMRQRLQTLAASPVLRSSRQYLDMRQQDLDRISEKLLSLQHLQVHRRERELFQRNSTLLPAYQAVCHRKRSALVEKRVALRALNPQKVLERGFAIVLDEKGSPVSAVSSLHKNQNLSIRFQDGCAKAQITELEEAE